MAALFALFFIVDVEFYGISFGLDDLKGNKYTNGILVGCADIVSCTLLGLFADRFGRKGAMMFSSLAFAIPALVYDLASLQDSISYGLLAVTRMGAAASFAIAYLFAQESYPTEVRGTIFGIANAFARLGGAFAPLVITLIPRFMLVLSGMAFVAFFLAIVMRETKGLQMEDYVVEPNIPRSSVRSSAG